MDRDELMELVTTEDVINILNDLGSGNPKKDKNNDNVLQFLTVCHGGDSHKLYYYIDSKFFVCYTSCGSMSLFDLIMSTNNVDFPEAFKYLCKFKNITNFSKKKKGLQKKEVENNDLKFLKLHLCKKEKQLVKLPSYNKYILNMFDDYIPMTWHSEGITDEITNIFQIKFYINQFKCIIPHFDTHGNLVGIRGRSFLQYQVNSGKKYMPITIQGLNYRYPIAFNLYGIYQNQENIRKIKKAILLESEKSTMLYGSYFGQENNISLSLCGMSFSLYQRDLLLSLGVEEVIICLDKQYQIELIDDENIDRNSKAWKEYENYIKGLIKISEMLIPYCNVSIIVCWDERIGYKDSPIDFGKETFEELYRERHYIDDLEELREMIK